MRRARLCVPSVLRDGSSRVDPAMREQFPDPACRLGGQPLKDIPEIAQRIMPIELRRLDQAHHRGSAMSGTQRPGEEPVGSSKGNRADAVFHPVVVNGQITVVDVADQRRPATKTVVNRLCGRRSVGHLLAMQAEPLEQQIGQRPGPLLTNLQSLRAVGFGQIPLDLVQGVEMLQRLFGQGAAVVGPQLVELASGVRLMPSAT